MLRISIVWSFLLSGCSEIWLIGALTCLSGRSDVGFISKCSDHLFLAEYIIVMSLIFFESKEKIIFLSYETMFPEK